MGAFQWGQISCPFFISTAGHRILSVFISTAEHRIARAILERARARAMNELLDRGRSFHSCFFAFVFPCLCTKLKHDHITTTLYMTPTYNSKTAIQYHMIYNNCPLFPLPCEAPFSLFASDLHFTPGSKKIARIYLLGTGDIFLCGHISTCGHQWSPAPTIYLKKIAVVPASSKCHGTAILGTAGRREEDTNVFFFFSFTVVLNKD